MWRLGLSYGNILLAARWSFPAPQPTFICKVSIPVGYFYVGTIVGADGSISFDSYPIPAAHPHFPYGIDVEPDNPE